MALYKHSIPILEYDTEPRAVINHDRFPEIRLPSRCVYGFLGETIFRYASANGAEIIEEYETITKTFPIYKLVHKEIPLCLVQAPLGSAAAVQLMDFLIGHGVTSIIAAGSCGALVALPENTFLLPTRALRDEGTSYQYLPAERYVETSPIIRSVAKEVMEEKGLQVAECTTWTTDGFYRETEAMVSYRREEGCQVVEMECAALAACAKFRNVDFAQLLYTADSLADIQNYDARQWGADSLDPALALCLDIAVHMPG